MEAPKLVSVKQVFFKYENGMVLSLEGEEAERFCGWFFADNTRTKAFNWNISKPKSTMKSFINKIVNWSPWR